MEIKVIEHSSELILIHSKYQDNNAYSYRPTTSKNSSRKMVWALPFLGPKGFRLCQSYRKSRVQVIQRCIFQQWVGWLAMGSTIG